MTSPERLILYLVAGIIATALQAIIVRYISKEKALIASVLTFISALIQFGVLFDILANLQQSGFIAILTYCVGVSIGTYAGTKLKILKEHRVV